MSKRKPTQIARDSKTGRSSSTQSFKSLCFATWFKKLTPIPSPPHHHPPKHTYFINMTQMIIFLMVDPSAIYCSNQISTRGVTKAVVCALLSVHIKEPLLVIRKCSPYGGSEFPLSLSGPLPCVQRHMGYSFRLAARVLLYASSHIQDNTYHGLCYTSRGALAGTRNSSMGSPHEGSIRRPIAP